MPHRVYKFVYLQLLNVKYKLVHLQLVDIKLLFSKEHIFCKENRAAVFRDARPWFRILNSPGKMTTCFLRETDAFLRYRTLCRSILKCGFPTKAIKLTWFVLSEVFGVPQLWGPRCRPFGKHRKENKRNYKARKFIVPD